jgi:hypothetical protein
VGGVDAWLRQRTAKPNVPRSAPMKNSPPPTQKKSGKRSPSTLNRLIAGVEKDMAKRTTRQTALYQDIADAGSDHVKLAALGEELAEIQSAIAVLENQWLEYTTELDS